VDGRQGHFTQTVWLNSAGIGSQLGQVFHITDDFSPESGITSMILQLTRYLASQGLASTILTAEGRVSLMPSDVNLMKFPLVAKGVWRWPQGLKSYLQRLPRVKGQILHLHGVWMGFQWVAARQANRQSTPVLLSPHGMLNRWHLRHIGFRELRKLIYWRTVAYPAFRPIPLIHAVTPRERDELATWLPGQGIKVIPNAIDLESMDSLLANAGEEVSPLVDEPYLLFLGRLHPVKGIDLLISAFAKAIAGINSKFRLLIVGPESDPAYVAELKSLVRLLGVEEKVTFLGPVFGPQKKLSLYRHAWAFCSPSQTEVMGLVNLEAASAELPVVTTHETGLGGWEEGGGILVHPQVEPLSRALKQVFSWSERERQDRGQKLRQLVERRYSWQAVGPQWLELYSGFAR
jgi:glycosyltransferase involved in cell wall biosynthesis